MTILVVAAHPDDETLGAGGTIARATNEGRDVSWLVLGDGVSSRPPTHQAISSAIAVRASECDRAAHHLGVQDISYGSMPDNRFDSIDLLDIIRLIESAINRVEPTLVLTHNRGDLNIDHQITHSAVVTATRPLAGASVKTVLAFEVPSSTEWNFGDTNPFSPSVFIDISKTLDDKVQALSEYESEMRPYPHPRSPEALRALAAWRGAASGVEAAEAFDLIRTIV